MKTNKRMVRPARTKISKRQIFGYIGLIVLVGATLAALVPARAAATPNTAKKQTTQQKTELPTPPKTLWSRIKGYAADFVHCSIYLYSKLIRDMLNSEGFKTHQKTTLKKPFARFALHDAIVAGDKALCIALIEHDCDIAIQEKGNTNENYRLKPGELIIKLDNDAMWNDVKRCIMNKSKNADCSNGIPCTGMMSDNCAGAEYDDEDTPPNPGSDNPNDWFLCPRCLKVDLCKACQGEWLLSQPQQPIWAWPPQQTQDKEQCLLCKSKDSDAPNGINIWSYADAH